jgi:hypothetical protein
MITRNAIPAACLTFAMTLAGCAGSTDAGAGQSAMEALEPPLSGAARFTSLHSYAAPRLERILFIADTASNVLLYTANITHHNPPLLGEITQGVTRSVGVCIDGSGTLYVVNNGGGSSSIGEYRRGTRTPFKTITNGLNAPSFVGVDRTGNLYVDDVGSNGDVVLVFASGASSPSRTISIPNGARRPELGGLAFDPSGDLLVDTFDVKDETSTVYIVQPGSSNPQSLVLQNVPAGLSLGTDKTGTIYAGGHEGDLAVYPPGSKTASRVIHLNVNGFYTDLAATPNGTVYWPNYDNNDLYEFAPGASSPTNLFTIQGSGSSAAVGSW